MSKRAGGDLQESSRVVERRKRLVALCRSLPGAEVERAGVQHLALKVARKIFGYYLFDHHGDGRIALCCKAPPGEQALLVEQDPKQYFVPPYVGKKGWVALRLDLPRVDWTAARSLLVGAHFMTAPKRVSRKLGSGGGK